MVEIKARLEVICVIIKQTIPDAEVINIGTDRITCLITADASCPRVAQALCEYPLIRYCFFRQAFVVNRSTFNFSSVKFRNYSRSCQIEYDKRLEKAEQLAASEGGDPSGVEIPPSGNMRVHAISRELDGGRGMSKRKWAEVQEDPEPVPETELKKLQREWSEHKFSLRRDHARYLSAVELEAKTIRLKEIEKLLEEISAKASEVPSVPTCKSSKTGSRVLELTARE
jgi:hypothetical protein